MKFKEGDAVQIISREQSESDAKSRRYYDFMGGLTGKIQNIYSESEIAVQIDTEALNATTRALHAEATKRMRTKLIDSLSEEQKKALTKEELDFDTHYMLLVHSEDLQKA